MVRVRDFNLNQERWQIVRKWWEAGDWLMLCRQARTVAEEALRSLAELHQVCDRSVALCRDRTRSRCETLESRRSLASGAVAAQLTREIDFERTVAVAMEQGIQHPVIRLDSVGAVFLSSQNPFIGMPDRSRSRFDE